MKLSPRHGFVTLSIGPLGNNWFTDLGNFHMLTHFILPYHTITVVNITISMFKSEKYLNIGGHSSHGGGYKFSETLPFAESLDFYH